jgi:hypothetical protein
MRLNVIAAGCAAFLLAASSAAAAPSAKSVELARRYAAALHMDNMVGSMMNNMMPSMLDQITKARGGEVPSELRIAVAEVAEESARAMAPKMIDAMLPAVAESFTEAELQAAVDYYESPLGQALLAKSPTFMAKATPAMTALMPQMQADFHARLCKKIGCEAKP